MQNRKGLIVPESITERAHELHAFFEDNSVPEVDRYTFAYYNLQAPENSLPEWTWSDFDRGLVAHNQYANVQPDAEKYDIEKLDALAGLLVPNYRKRAEGLSPVLDSFKHLGDEIVQKLEHGSVLCIANHPTIVTPIIVGRACAEALTDKIPDIQDRMYIALGLKPTVFKYDFGEFGAVSPVGMVSAVGNVAVTAAVSDSNTQPEIKPVQDRFRHFFKGTVADALSRPGNIVVVILNGQTDVPYTALGTNGRKIHMPESSLELYEQPNVWVVNASVYDTLLEGRDITSPVQLYVHPRIRPVSEDVLKDANAMQAALLDPTYDDTRYFAERDGELDVRLRERRRMLGSYIKDKMGDITGRP